MKQATFPTTFCLGAATASFQIEGARELRDECIWDRFCKQEGMILNGDNGDVACDSYHQLEKDVDLLKALHLKAYRFSVSWSRVIKNGIGEINQDGLNYYKKLVHLLKENHIQPFLTLYHWDLPQCLQDQGGWVNPSSVDWFLYYAKVIFDTFLDDVACYVTFNEPYCAIELGYYYGNHAPGYQSKEMALQAGMNMLRAHGKAVQLFRTYQLKAKIGICLNLNDYQPIDKQSASICDYVKKKEVWWYFYPLFLHHFPEEIVKEYDKLNLMPSLCDEDYELFSTPLDFLGVNYYQSQFYDENGKLVCNPHLEHTSLGWNIDAEGLYRVIKEIRQYTTLPIYILENGMASQDKNLKEAIHDQKRIEYFKSHLQIINRCNAEKMNICGYFAWSLIDNFEWAYGYSQRFGIVYVDFDDPKRTRTIKDSGYFIKEVAEKIDYGREIDILR